MFWLWPFSFEKCRCSFICSFGLQRTVSHRWRTSRLDADLHEVMNWRAGVFRAPFKWHYLQQTSDPKQHLHSPRFLLMWCSHHSSFIVHFNPLKHPVHFLLSSMKNKACDCNLAILPQAVFACYGHLTSSFSRSVTSISSADIWKYQKMHH